MRSIAKTLVPTVILRHLRALRVRHNRRSIAAASNGNAPIVLTPDTVVEHYYHFMFDLALPLFLLLEATPHNAPFIVNTTGPFLPRLKLLFPDRVLIADKDFEAGGPEKRLLGMNPFFVEVAPHEALAFSRYVRSMVGVESSVTRNKVLLIERLPPQPFFATAAKSRGGGASRRHIPNHDDVARALQSLVRAPFEFQNVHLEQLSFEEQVRLFAHAALVVGQHGAGFANCLWMQPGSKVVELTNRPDLTHFQRLSRAMGHDHILHHTSGAHDPIDADGLAAHLRREPSLGEILDGR